MIKWVTEEVFVKASVDSRKIAQITNKRHIEQMYHDAKILLQEIKRHCDYYDLCIDNDGYFVCTFCGETVADKDDYECCDESVTEHERLKV